MKVDRDFAGCEDTRLSTSCCIQMRWQTCAKVLESNPEDPGVSTGQQFGFDLETDSSACEKRSGEDTSSSHPTVMVATVGDEPRVADLEGGRG